MKLEKRTRTISLAVIGIVTTLFILSASIPKPASAVVFYCQTCMPKEFIEGDGFGELICSNGVSYPNTQINFNAMVTIKVPGPAKGSVTLTATTADATTAQIQGTITSGAYNPSGKMNTFSLSGTSTSDALCGIPNSPFTISGSTGNSVPISVTGGKYDFKGTGDVKGAPAKA